jgi:hypothetical protein
MFLKRRCARCWSRPLIAMSLWLTLVPAAPAQAPAPAARSAAAARDWAPLDRIMGRPGKLQPGGVYKYGFPRADLHVRLDGVALRPAFALTSWVAFEAGAADTMAMGDVVLSEAEVTPVLTKVEEMGMEVTALHNHVLRESPRVMYLHIEAEGRASEIARGLRAALALTGTPPASPPGTPSQPPPQLDTTAVKEALGYAGMVNGGVYQVSVPRAEAVRAGGMEVPPAMGVASAINFQPTGGGKAAVTGDLVLTGNEVGPVIQALRHAGIEVTAVHSHMLAEEPRLFFLHYWANADAAALARGLRAALARMNVARPTS